VWIGPLSTQGIIPEQNRANFIEQVFWNIHDIIGVNTRLRDVLVMRQKSYTIIEGIADIFLDIVPHFAPFVSYGSHQLYGKYEFEKEKSSNPAFAQFVRVSLTVPCLHLPEPVDNPGLGNGAPARVPQARTQCISYQADDTPC
jgi:RHO1 GDP-GTP exchange protein 1/2